MSLPLALLVAALAMFQPDAAGAAPAPDRSLAAPAVASNAASNSAPMAPSAEDPWLWLEDVQGERALAWARERNGATRERLQAWPEFAGTRDALRAILDSRARIPSVVRRGTWFYNFWQDATHPRGLLRRATLDEYRQPEPRWETVLDLDALARTEGENWVWGGANCLGPEYRRCMISLSRGGADAKVLREFDVVDRAFVSGGFNLPEAKSAFTWIDADTAFVATDFGAGSMTDSGYPRVIKRWTHRPCSRASPATSRPGPGWTAPRASSARASAARWTSGAAKWCCSMASAACRWPSPPMRGWRSGAPMW
jgi:prolyl oligopeptidase